MSQHLELNFFGIVALMPCLACLCTIPPWQEDKCNSINVHFPKPLIQEPQTGKPLPKDSFGKAYLAWVFLTLTCFFQVPQTSHFAITITPLSVTLLVSKD